MSSVQKRTVIVLAVISIVLILLLDLPNSLGSKDRNMVGVFSQDEYAQYPHVIRMLRGGQTFQEAARRFFYYQHYHYGFPHYLFSAMVLLPLRLRSIDLNQTSLIMLLLRQIVSVIPMLLAIATLVYMQTQFKRFWASVFLFGFLLTIPAVFENNFWWHPDSLAILFVTLTFFFLLKDDFEYGRYFGIAAITCGLTVGTKLFGFFFFLAIPVYLYLGLRRGKLDIRDLSLRALLFVAVMAIVILLSNPILLTSSGRADYWRMQSTLASSMGSGWSVYYEQGLGPWLDLLARSYAAYPLFALTVLALIYSIILDRNRLLSILIICWAVPFSAYIIQFVVIRPTHFLLPIMLPLLSSLAVFFPGRETQDEAFTLKATSYLASGLLFLFFLQNLLFARSTYYEFVHRIDHVPSIDFFQTVQSEFLSKIPKEERLSVLRDVRAYVADNRQLQSTVYWGLVDQTYVDKEQYDLIFLNRQRILDYTQSGSLEQAIEPGEMELAIEFFTAAENGAIPGYVLLYADDFGYFFASDEVVETYSLLD